MVNLFGSRHFFQDENEILKLAVTFVKIPFDSYFILLKDIFIMLTIIVSQLMLITPKNPLCEQ